ncbi:MAG: hypothetical protein DRG71_09325 [Deltaproteobacteria bacterium]|nr:MAG: hypothetical protein DRG71_09325 [Deltaproteobacteria bacterium]HDG98590.1 hypothetical protein [Desulfobacterales bacterium]
MKENGRRRQMTEILVERLMERGISPEMIPRVAGLLARAINQGETVKRAGIAGSLENLGIQLDDDILHLVKASMVEVSLQMPDDLLNKRPESDFDRVSR